MRAFQRERDALTVRTRMCVAAWGIAPVEEESKLKERIEGMGVTSGFGDEWLKVDALKFMPDGGVGDRTALMYEPYLDEPNNYGQSVIDPEVFYDLVQWAHDLGWSIETHACGDRMIELTAEAYADAMKRTTSMVRQAHHAGHNEDSTLSGIDTTPSKDKPRVRHRIHHAYLPTRRALQLMRESETIAIVQPAFIYNLGESYVKSIGLERARRMNSYRTYLMNGIPLAGSSDSPVTVFNPFVGLYAAVKHQTVLGTPFDQRENLTMMEALRAFTRGSAYVTFEEDVRGSIEVGKYADFVALADDLLTIPIGDVKDAKPTLTVVGGRVC